MQLRDYQEACLKAIQERRKAGTHRQLITLPTGSGKTLAFAHLPKIYSQKMIVLAHREELLEQAKGTLQAINPDLKVSIEQAGRKAELDSDVIIASVPTLGREGSARIEKLDPAEWSLIVVDEAHHTPAATYQNILKHFCVWDDPTKLLTGWTATPKRGDSMGLEETYQDIVFQKSLREMIDAGWLCPIKGFRVTTSADLSGIHKSHGDYAEGELSEVVNTAARNRLAVQAYQDLAGNKKAIVFCVDVAHAKAMAEEFQKAGIACDYIVGELNHDERAKRLTGLKTGALKVLSNCSVLSEGYDQPDLECIIMARPTLSSLLYQQCLGRGTRTSPGKEALILIDMVDNSSKHELVGLNSLFGLKSGFNLGGRSITGVVKKLETMAASKPGVSVFAAESLEAAAKLVEQFDIFNPQKLAPAQLKSTRLTWIEQDWELYCLFFGKSNKMQVRRDLLGRYEATLLVPTEGKWGERIVVSDDLDDAMNKAEDYFELHYQDEMPLVLKAARWRKNPASEKQLDLLRSLGVAVPIGLTKGEASLMITKALRR